MRRTYVRRRLVLLACACALITTLAVPVATALGVSAPAAPPATRTYVVRPGDTLWSIALRVSPTADPRPTVRSIAELNGVAPGALRPGHALEVPVGRP